MKTNIAAFTSRELELPAYISINRTANGLVSISIRGAKKLDADKGYNVSGDTAEIIMSREELIGLLHEAHDELFADAAPEEAKGER